MNDIAVDFVKKMFNRTSMGKSIIESNDPVAKEDNYLSHKVKMKERIIENKLKLKVMRSITDESIDKVFDNDVNEFINSAIQVKIADYMNENAWRIVDEALEDLEDDYGLTSSIRQKVVNQIKSAF